LAFRAVQLLVSRQARWLVVDAERQLHPVTLARWGFDLNRVVWAQPPPDLVLWTVEQGLRSGGVAVVWCAWERIPLTASQRLKLAALAGSSHCVLCRPALAERESSAADLRLLVQPQRAQQWGRRQWQVDWLRLKTPGQERRPGTCEQIVSDERDGLCLVSELGGAVRTAQATGA
jgi:hypothetical protein